MEKYIGKFRVVCEFDRKTLKPIKDDVYIVCANDGQVFRINNTTLAYYRPTNGNDKKMCEKLVSLGVREVINRSTEGDMLIYFNEDSLDIVVDVFKASVNGASINPTSVRNLRRLKWFKDNKEYYMEKGLYKELSEDEKNIFRQRFNNLNRESKLNK